jgi:hypothetical protein
MLCFYEDKGEGWAYNVGVELDPDKILISEWNLSQAAKDCYGDSDTEFFLIIKRKNAESFLRACCNEEGLAKEKVDENPTDQIILDVLKKLYMGKKSAFMDIKKVLQKNDISYEFQHW